MRANSNNTQSAARSLAVPGPSLSPMERALSLFAPMQRGEGRATMLLALNIFIVLVACYMLKVVRETLVLTEGGAEVKSLATAGQAIALVALMPLYAAWSRGRNRLRLVQGVTLFFVSNLVIFAALGLSGIRVGVAFFVWHGVFNLFVVAQFWAFAAELHRVESGQRLFALIMGGAALGAFTGARIAGELSELLGHWGLMGLAGCALVATTGLMTRAAAHVPAHAARTSGHAPDTVEDRSCGFGTVLRDGYLRLIALFVVTLNLIQSTGEYVLSRMVIDHAESAVQAGQAVSHGAVIGAFYADFYSWMSILNIAVQLLLVSRVIRLAGVGGALLVLPVVAALGYGLIAFLPIFSLVAVVQLTGNSLNYSIQNTARQALFLPVDGTARFQGKTAIETFFWRTGDLLQAGVVAAGFYLLEFGTTEFALFNATLAVGWIAVAVLIGRRYQQLSNQEATS